MKKIFLYTVLLLVTFFQVAFSQTVTVLDKETLTPIKGAKISVNDKDFVYTNVLGQADVSQFKGNESVKFQASGYQAMVYTFSRLETDKFSVSLGSKSYSTDEIVVSADRFNELMKDVPRQIDVLNSKDIQYSNVQNTAQLLEKTGNVSVQTSQQGGGSVVLRGFEASRVLIVVDGVRLNNAIFRAGHLQNILRIDNNILDKAEVLFGPGSLMYGSDALGGVMNFYTKDPVLSLNNNMLTKGDAAVRYSTANQEKMGHMNISLGGKNIGFMGSFTFSDFGDLRMGGNYEPTANNAWKRYYYTERINGVDVMVKNDNPNIQKQSAYQQYDAIGKLLVKQSDKVQHTFAFQYSNTNDVPRYDRLNIYSGANLKFAQWYYGPETRLMGSYKLDLKNDHSFYDNAQLTLAYQNVKESRNTRRFGNDNLYSQNEKVDVMSGNLDFYKKLKENEVRYGIEGTYNILKSTATKNNIVTGATAPDISRYPDGDNNMLSLAAYFSHSWEINKQFTLSDGLRFSYVSLKSTFVDTTFYQFPFSEAKQNNSAINASLGLVFMPTTDWRIYVNGASGFRAPNFDDLSKIFETGPGNVIVPNSNLKPEYTYTGELGISKIFDNRIKLEGIAYGTIFSNAIITAPFQFNGQDSVTYQGTRSKVYANQNADKGAYILGYNLNMSADLTNYLSLTSSLNFTYGRIKTDSIDVPLDHIPPVIGKTSLIVKLNKFKGDFTVMYNGWKRIWNFSDSGEDNQQDATPSGMPSWYTLNLGGAYQLTPNLQIQARLDNLLDMNYRTFASGFNAPGRNFVLSLRGSL